MIPMMHFSPFILRQQEVFEHFVPAVFLTFASEIVCFTPLPADDVGSVLPHSAGRPSGKVCHRASAADAKPLAPPLQAFHVPNPPDRRKKMLGVDLDGVRKGADSVRERVANGSL